jgi:hypothetical protein
MIEHGSSWNKRPIFALKYKTKQICQTYTVCWLK